MLRRFTVLLSLLVILLRVTMGIPQRSLADSTYHSPPIPLSPVGANADGSGFVINAHANGPQVVANENYVLLGAEANTAYSVVLQVYVGDPSCSTAAFTVPSETIETNQAGNGHANHRFIPADVPPELHNATHGIVWQVLLDSQVVYESPCEVVTID